MMVKFFLILTIISITTRSIVDGQAIEQCYKCTGVDVKEPGQCAKDFDFCNGHDRCLLMQYKGPNGNIIYDAMCKFQNECDGKEAETILCDKKTQCKVDLCCKGALCNTASGTWLRFDLKMLMLVVMGMVVLLQQ